VRPPIYFSGEMILQLLPIPDLAAELALAFVDLSKGKAKHSERQVISLEEGALGSMLGASKNYIGGKVVAVLPKNRERELNPHQGLVLLLDSSNGCPLAIANASEITALRTAAASYLATSLLSRKDSAVLTVVGTGLQAEFHIRAIRESRNIQEIRVIGRTRSTADSFVKQFQEAKAFDSVREALQGTDILCLCTSAETPYLHTKELPQGIHVNAIGACRPGISEIEINPAEIPTSFYVESITAAREESEEIRTCFESGDTCFEIGRLLTGDAPGRISQQQITFYKGVGIGLEDVAALSLAFRNHQARFNNGFHV
jgi:alanine dehydrogenase